MKSNSKALALALDILGQVEVTQGPHQGKSLNALVVDQVLSTGDPYADAILGVMADLEQEMQSQHHQARIGAIRAVLKERYGHEVKDEVIQAFLEKSTSGL